MIVTELIVRDDGATLIRTFSDEGYMIEQTDTGKIYSEAVDVQGSGHSYEETDLLIDDDLSDEELLNILLGGDVDE